MKDMLAELRQSRDDWNAQDGFAHLATDRCEARREASCLRALSGGGLYSRSAEVLCARSADPLIVHDFEAEVQALIQAGHSCAFDGAYID